MFVQLVKGYNRCGLKKCSAPPKKKKKRFYPLAMGWAGRSAIGIHEYASKRRPGSGAVVLGFVRRNSAFPNLRSCSTKTPKSCCRISYPRESRLEGSLVSIAKRGEAMNEKRRKYKWTHRHTTGPLTPDRQTSLREEGLDTTGLCRRLHGLCLVIKTVGGGLPYQDMEPRE
jgi:hypothetical protein